MNLGDWQETILLDAPVAGHNFPIGVCNGYSFMGTATDTQTWTTEKTDSEAVAGCSEEDSAIKRAATADLQGQLTVQKVDGRIELTNPSNQFVLESN